MNEIVSMYAPDKLSELSLDAAMQLDRLSKSRSADRSVLTAFANVLRSPSEGTSEGDVGFFCLNENPLNVDIMTSALDKAGEARATDIATLSSQLEKLLKQLNDVAGGSNPSADDIRHLKRFCVSLHQVLLNDYPAFHNDDPWLILKEFKFA